MRARNFRELGLLLPGLLAMAGCAAAPEAAAPVAVVQAAPQVVEAPTEVVEEPTYQAREGITPQERFQLAIQQLSEGQVDEATIELETYTGQVDNAPRATYLLNQIRTPVAELYPAENFTVQIAPGETLSSLAGTYLGNVLGFYGLARYNEIENPSQVSVGQSIRIPSTAEALAARETVANAPAAPPAAETPAQTAAVAPPPAAPVAPPPPAGGDDAWASVRAHVAAQRYGEAIMEAEDSRLVPNAEQAVVLASAYDSNARAIRGSNQVQAAQHAVRAGELYLNTANQPERAMSSLELATELAPGNAEAQTLLATAKTRTADMYYRNGVQAFQRQDLDGAIAAYDRVLEIDPNHQNAQVNRQQALQLRANLQQLQ
jgi:tetratricopeptide (TPR) repeat protein